MRKLAVDVGQSRVGLAISEGSLAIPLDVLAFSENAVSEVVEIAQQKQVAAIYVGLPLSLSGNHTQSTANALTFARQLAAFAPVRLIDERLTTKSAHALLRASGKNAKNSKGIVDAQAAQQILEFALQSEREGQLAGKDPSEFDE